MDYEEIYQNGVHVVGLPNPHFGWFIYAAPCRGYEGVKKKVYELFWVNHENRVVIEYFNQNTQYVNNPTK